MFTNKYARWAWRIVFTVSSLITLVVLFYVIQDTRCCKASVISFDLANIQVQTFILRIFNSFLILYAGIELFRATYLVGSKRATRWIWKLAMFFLSFFVIRIFASFADNLIGYDIGWFSNLANVLFWGLVIYRCRYFRRGLQSQVPIERRQSFRSALDEVIDHMEHFQKKIDKLPGC